MSPRVIVGPDFFEDERGRAVIINSERYVEMLDNFLVPELQDLLAIKKKHGPSRMELHHIRST